MDTPAIDFHSLETPQDRRTAIDHILAVLGPRPYYGQEALEFVFEKIGADSELIAVTQILRSLEHVCKTVWKDDLYQGEPYADAVRDLNAIAGDLINILHVSDGYCAAKDGDDFELKIETDQGEFVTELNRGRGLHFGFLRPFFAAFAKTGAAGSFYGVQCDYLEDGVAFLYLNPDEHERVIQSDLFNLYDLNERAILDCINVFWRPIEKTRLDDQAPNFQQETASAASEDEASQPSGPHETKTIWQRLFGR